MNLLRLIVSVLSVVSVSAHPGSHDHNEASVRRDFLQRSRRNLSHCTDKFQQKGYSDRQKVRRQEFVHNFRISNGLDKRYSTDINKSHHSDGDYSLATPAEFLFTSNNSCVLSPEVIEGPYCESTFPWFCRPSMAKLVWIRRSWGVRSQGYCRGRTRRLLVP